jgi:hypothetical protein
MRGRVAALGQGGAQDEDMDGSDNMDGSDKEGSQSGS